MPNVEIRVERHLNTAWAEWLEGFTFTYTDQGETILRGQVGDQAALYGLFAKLRDLGVKLISVEIEGREPDDNPVTGFGDSGK